MPKVIVTDSSERAALAVIRSLGRRDIEVIAADSTSFNSGFLSKYCSRRIIYPSPQKDKKKFVESMLHLVRTQDFDLLIPITDFTMIPILERKDEFEEYIKVAIPPYETAIKALDKAQTIKIAEEHGIPCPKTFLVEDFEVLKKIAKDLRYPVVIKPRMKILWILERAIILKVTEMNYAYNCEDLMTKYAKIMSRFKGFEITHDLFLVQEYTKGEGYGVEALMHNSKVNAIFMHKRLREYPIMGGASTLRVSVKNEKLEKFAIDLLKAMQWEGVAMVEFKVEEKSKDIKLMEVNGRFWGSLPLAISAGVDFPFLLYKVTMDEDISTCYDYKVGIMQKWLLPGDLLWLCDSFRGDVKSMLRSIAGFLDTLGIPDDVISLNDFSPTIGALLSALHEFNNVIIGKRTIYGEIEL